MNFGQGGISPSHIRGVVSCFNPVHMCKFYYLEKTVFQLLILCISRNEDRFSVFYVQISLKIDDNYLLQNLSLCA